MAARLLRQLALLALLVIVAGALAGGQWGLRIVSAAPRLARGLAQTGLAGPNQAGLVIRFSDSQVVTRCVSFTETTINGKQLLERSGLVPGISPDGRVCSIDNQGCPTDDCWCQCPFPDCRYWAYFHLTNGAWVYSNVGASGYQTVGNGSIEGWSWGQGDTTSGVPPPLYTFEQVCPAAAPANTPTATATATATSPVGATPTATATRTATPQGSQPTAPPGQVAPPQVTFRADSTTVDAGSCTLLSWLVWDATQVTLNGAQVIGQDQQRVCPTSTQTYTLTALNASGQTTRQITILVTGSSGVGQSPLATPATAIYAAPTPASVYRQVVRPQSPAAQQPPTPAAQPQATPQTGSAAVSPLAAPPAQPVEQAPVSAVTPTPTPTIYYALAAEPTATPRPRRILVAGEPTPTPILVARVDAGQPPAAASDSDAAASDAADGPPRLAVENRAFTPDLLPGYALFLLAAAALLAAAVWVVHRKAPRRAGR